LSFFEGYDETPPQRRIFASAGVAGALVLALGFLLAAWLLSDKLLILGSSIFAFCSMTMMRWPRAVMSRTELSDAGALRVYEGQVFEELAAREFGRVRRYERPLTLLSLAVVDGYPPLAVRRQVDEVAELVSSFLRQTDLLGRSACGRLLVMLPETSREDVSGLIARLGTVLPEEKHGLVLGIASFPQDDVTWVGLRAFAEESEVPFHQHRDRPSEGPDDPPSGPAAKPRPLPRLRSRRLRRARPSGLARRAVDLTILLALAPLVLPLLALLALAVKLDSPGPVLVRHERLGQGGRRFRLLKLRTMVIDAELMKAELSHLNTLPWPDFKIPNDPRITRLGRWLRVTSLDELPQLWNMLRGELTLIGPRPCSIPVGHYELWQTERLEAMPGIFGHWQANGRARVSFAGRCRMDIDQIKNRTLGREVKLVARTVLALLSGRGAS